MARKMAALTRADVCIVGAGHAGAQTAISLRQKGFAGSIVIVSNEDELPYERPPLSKSYLAGKTVFAKLLLRPESFWEEKGIQIRLGEEVTAVEAAGRKAILKSGDSISYGQLVWAAGGKARRVGGELSSLADAHVIRSKADVDSLRAALATTKGCSIVIVGAGYIGLEAAAVLVDLGCNVTIIELQDRPLARVAGEEIASFFQKEHERHGVKFRFGERISEIHTGPDGLEAVRLSSGELVVCDVAIEGIGIEPSVAPLLAAGADGGSGVRVDSHCRTSLPSIFAVGDCAEHRNSFAGDLPIRIESVQNAADMAKVAAANICGEDLTYNAVPWFWSNQYDLKLQTVGLTLRHDTRVVRRGRDEQSFSVVYLRNGHVVALDCVNATKDYVQGRKLVERAARIDPADLIDETRQLKELLC